MLPGIRSLAVAMHLEIHRVYTHKGQLVLCYLPYFRKQEEITNLAGEIEGKRSF
ncbi:hypothetical protein [Photorhabdus australis]|uniref:hypothetical protein n=1 Tax=Photorhabdus australis TaxID=286156 RepID=UPI0030D80346